ncbi:hypothetical protein T4A_7034 [Trichinella pseudospiralis]|uniref:Uncharacterized protein n=3 Tax=Trichinella pseudospiralis TaxID=6337 RepID=A0A0V1EH33_TRIPS|nr:hypothetical protein T4A_7034 [Trichinella pseudospiralis]KRZ39205.1 hypothetical protein T4C_14161 [Trichinella pseudospiralis]
MAISLHIIGLVVVFLIKKFQCQQADYALPPLSKFNPFEPGTRPFPGRSGVDLFPQFPLTHQFVNGIERGSGGGLFMKANLNIPIPKWKAVWDIKGYLTSGTNAPWYSYGHVVRPVNMLGLKSNEIMRMLLDPAFQQARLRTTSPPVSVAKLPADWNPVHCKPPICNPFVHTVGVGVQSQPSKNYIIDGLLDFPIRTGPYGEGLRFPLTGTGYFGEFPAVFIYGQHINAIDPFPTFTSQQRS